MKKKSTPVYTVWYKRTGTYEAKIEANSLKEALEKAEKMTTSELNDTPGDVIDEEHTLTAVWE